MVFAHTVNGADFVSVCVCVSSHMMRLFVADAPVFFSSSVVHSFDVDLIVQVSQLLLIFDEFRMRRAKNDIRFGIICNDN